MKSTNDLYRQESNILLMVNKYFVFRINQWMGARVLGPNKLEILYLLLFSRSFDFFSRFLCSPL